MAKTKLVKSKKKSVKSPAKKAHRSVKASTSSKTKTVSLEMKLHKTLAENHKVYGNLVATGQKTVKSLANKIAVMTKSMQKSQDQLEKIDAKFASKPSAALKKTRVATQKGLEKYRSQFKLLERDLSIGQAYLDQVSAEQVKCQALTNVIKDFYKNYDKPTATRVKSPVAVPKAEKTVLKSVKSEPVITPKEEKVVAENKSEQSQTVHFQEPEYFTIGS